MYLFTGSDSEKVRKQAFAFVEASRKKAPMAPYLRLSSEEINEDSLLGAIHTQGLFYDRSLVVLDNPFERAESAEVVLNHLELLEGAGNPVFIIAPKLLPARRKKIEGKASKVFAFDIRVKEDTRGFNSALVNALSEKDGKTLWMEIVKAMRLGDPPELIHGLLHFKARDLMEKGGRYIRKEEARALSVALIELVSAEGRDTLPLGVALERFALTLSR